jgi:hypothetical protein
MQHSSSLSGTLAKLASITLLAAALALAATSALAQEKFKYSFQNPPEIVSTYKEAHNIDVGDVPGHVLRLSALQLVYPATGPAPMYSGVRVKESNTVLKSDLQDGNGAASGYTITTLVTGDKVFLETSLIVQTAPGELGKPTTRVTQTYVIAGGTGKFKNIRGVLRASSVTDFKTATRGAVSEGEYYFAD